MHYPDLAARVYTLSPQKFLWEVAETIKQGCGYPKILNDEEIIPTLISFGAPREDAMDYTVSGCTEVRMINRDTEITPASAVNYGCVVESLMYNGRLSQFNYERFGPETGDPTHFAIWEEFWAAFLKQHEYFLGVGLISHYLASQMYPSYYASPLDSALHDLCMADCRDLHEKKIKGGVDIGFCDVCGFATLVDSLCAIKKMVYEEKRLTMQEVLDAMKNDFTGPEGLRVQKILMQAPAFGNHDPYSDAVALAVDTAGTAMAKKYSEVMGKHMTYRCTPVTTHVAFGTVVGATPDGRKAKTALSDGTSPSQGRDTNGPASILLSQFASKDHSSLDRTARLLNIKFTPGCVAGDEGTEKLVSFLRTLVDFRLWHVQFNVVNQETLLAAQKNPENYRSLIVRIAGYSAYFCDLSKTLQDDLIRRTAIDSF